MPLDWHDFYDRMSPVMQLVHLAARMDAVDIEEWRGRLLRMRRAAYEQELTLQARKLGCNRTGRLGEGDVLSQLNDVSQRDAASIANTFNYYLASTIVKIRSEVPTANRHVYAARIAEWERGYWAWKMRDIEMMTMQSARAMAQSDFYRMNSLLMGTAKLEPTMAVCPVCKGWIARGLVPLRIALNNPPPYHNNCPHGWDIRTGKIARSECANLWMGE